MIKIRIPFMSILIVSTLIFQVSIIPDSLNIRAVSRVVNIITLFTFLGLCIGTMNHKKDLKILLFYIYPIVFILFGFAINLLRNLDIELLRYSGIMLPWLAAFSIPFVPSFNTEKAWNIFYIFMIFTTIISLIEYFAIFSGLLTPSIVVTNNGIFLKGVISIVYPVGFYADIPTNRFYGVFTEPGNAAMILIAALSYALVFSKRLATFVFILAIYLTESVGGFFALGLLMILFTGWKLNDLHYSFPKKLLAVLFAISLIFILLDRALPLYEKKEKETRESNVTNFIDNFSDSLLINPFGFQFKGEALSNLQSDSNYYGSNFMPYVAFVQGGVLGFLGYSLFCLSNIIFSIKYYLSRHNQNRLFACAFLALPPMLTFIFQRSTILETSLFAFLFSAPLIEMIRGIDPVRKLIIPQKEAVATMSGSIYE